MSEENVRKEIIKNGGENQCYYYWRTATLSLVSLVLRDVNISPHCVGQAQQRKHWPLRPFLTQRIAGMEQKCD